MRVRMSIGRLSVRRTAKISPVTAAAAAVSLISSAALAASGTWTNGASANWSDSASWTDAIIADGSASTADFSTIDPTADVTVTLDASRSIGNLTFGDTDTATAASWIIAGTNTLTLDGVASSTITVNALGTGKVARIDDIVAGGFTKAGSGELVLTNTANTAAIRVTGGTLTGGTNTSYSNAGLGSGTITLAGGTLRTLINTSNTWTMGNALVVDPGTSTLVSTNRMRMNGAVSGAGTLNFSVNSTVARMDLQNSWTGFSGNLNFTGSGTVRLGIVALASGQPNFNAGSWASTTMDLGGSVVLSPSCNSGGNTLSIGSLSGSSASAALSQASGGTARWTVGALDTAATTKTYAGRILSNSALIKNGPGALTLTNTTGLTYTANTDINGGRLVINGAKAGIGAVNVNNGGALGGMGSVAGAVTVASGGSLSAGDISGANSLVGTLTLSTSLTLASGSKLSYDFGASTNDLVYVSAASGLTLNGGALSLYQEGTNSIFSTNGTYNIFQYVTSYGGNLANVTVDPASKITGKLYSFADAGGYITLTIADDANLRYWNVDADGYWGTGSNWTGGVVPNAVQATAGFGVGGATLSAPRTVTVDGSQTLGTLRFDSPTAFTLAAGSASILTLDNNGSAADITVNNGSHSIEVPIALTANGLVVTVTNAADILSVSGGIVGPGTLSKGGPGVLLLSDSSSYTGATNITAGTLKFGSGNALPTSTALTVGGILDLGGYDQTAGALAGAGSITNSGSADAILALDSGAFSGTITDGATNKTGIAKNGAGTLLLSTAHSFTGGIALNGGTLSIGISQGAGSASNTISAANGTTIYATSGVGSGAVAAAIAVSGTNANVTLQNNNASGGINSAFSGSADQTLTISNAGGTVVNLNSTTKQLQNFLGTLSVPAGNSLAFRATSLNNGGDNTTFDINGSMSTRNGGAIAIGALTGSGTVGMGSAGSSGAWLTYTIGAKNLASAEFSGVIQDADTVNGKRVAINKVGDGIQIFSGANTYSGTTTVTAGTLRAGNASALGTGGITMAGGTLDYNGYGITNPVTYTSGTLLGAPTGLTMTVANGGNLDSTGFTFSTTTVNSGGTLGGTGSAGALSILAGGTLAPGGSPGQLTASTANLAGTTVMEVGGTTLGTGYDNLLVTTADGLTYGGTLSVVNYAPYDVAAQVGSYQLFSFTGTAAGDFTGVTVLGTSLTNTNGVWTGGNYTFTQSTGTLDVTIPEPGTVALLLGVSGMGLMARRRRA